MSEITSSIDELLADCAKLWREFDVSKPTAKAEAVKIRLGLLVISRYLNRLRLDPDIQAAAANAKLIQSSQKQIEELRAQLQKPGDQK